MCDQIIIEKLDLVLNKINALENEFLELKSMINNHKQNTKNEVVSVKPSITGLHLSPALIDMTSTQPIMSSSKSDKSCVSAKTKKVGSKYDVSKIMDGTLNSILKLNNTKQTRETVKNRIVGISEINGFDIIMNNELVSFFKLETTKISLVEFEILMNKIFE